MPPRRKPRPPGSVQDALTNVVSPGGFEHVYCQLKAIAAIAIAQRGAWTVARTTSLLHEALPDLLHPGRPWDSPGHFFTAARRRLSFLISARVRRLLRRRERGSSEADISRLVAKESGIDAAEIMDLTQRLERLKREDPQVYEIIRLEFFENLSRDQIAERVQVSAATVWRRRQMGLAFLQRDWDEDEGKSPRPA